MLIFYFIIMSPPVIRGGRIISIFHIRLYRLLLRDLARRLYDIL